MASLRLDVEEWQSVFRVLVAVSSTDQTPCLKSAIVGVGSLLTMAGVVGDQHDCEESECEKALESVAAHLRAGHDPFRILLEEGDEAVVEVDPFAALEGRVRALEEAVFANVIETKEVK